LPVRESDLLQRIAERSAGMPAAFPHVVLGPGDDCAAVRPPGGAMLLTVDQVIERRHFVSGTPLDLVARKAVARSISDLAAMGATPWCALATGALPAGFAQSDADALCVSIKKWAEHWNCPMVGGDLASMPDAASPLTLTVTAIGVAHASGHVVTRAGAKPGDHVFVTGALGGSFDRATGMGRHLTFEPRLREAAWLLDTFGDRVHAMIDLSDGLGRDASRIAEASDVRIELDAGAIPRHPGVADWRAAASEGEDYELLFCVDPGAEVPEACPITGTRMQRIGIVCVGQGCIVRDSGRKFPAENLGWEHADNSGRHAETSN
jgi:thiamine-monophosphate kinase